MSALEHLISVDRDLTAAVYRTACELTPWPADVPRPTEADLDAMDRLEAGLDCGRCEDEPAYLQPEITAEQARAANAANPNRPFGPVRPRAARSFPARCGCYCHHPGQWPAYEAMQARWPAQAALRAAYDRISHRLPKELGYLISAGWIDREAVLEALGSTGEVAVTAGPAEETAVKARRNGWSLLSNPNVVAVLNALGTPAKTWEEVASRCRLGAGDCRKLSAALQEAKLIREKNGEWLRETKAERWLEEAGKLKH